MITLEYLNNLSRIIYNDIIDDTEFIQFKLRITLRDKSFIDIYIPPRKEGGFGFHWERRHIDRTFYRYDNCPNTKWRNISTFPYHFHNGSQDKVEVSNFSKEFVSGFKDFMDFVRAKLETERR